MDKSNILEASSYVEVAILGAIILDNTCFYQCEGISTDDFSLSGHRLIYRAMCELMDGGQPVDFVTLCDLLGKWDMTGNTDLMSVGGTGYVMRLTDGVPRTKNIRAYTEKLLDYSRRRKLIIELERASNQAYDTSIPVIDLVKNLDSQLLGIEDTNSPGPQKIGNVLKTVNTLAREEWEKPKEAVSAGYRTGLDSLDEFTTGYRKREVTVIGGWTSDGKTSLMRQSVLAQMKDGVRSLVFSREVSREQVVDDLKTFIANISPSHARDKRRMDLFERQKYFDVDQIIKDWPLWIDDDRGLHIDEVQHRARKLIRLEGIEIVFADYLGLIRGSGSNPTEKMEDVCEGLWQLADEEHIPVVVLAQLSRDRDKVKRRPKLQDLKQASRIEQDAHVVIFVFRPEDEKSKLTQNDEVIVAKNRHGATGILRVEFDENTLQFKQRTCVYA